MKQFLFYLIPFAFCFLTGCSVPNLEPPECIESREVVRDFYSFHLGNDMKFSQENLKLREKYLTTEYFKSLQTIQNEGDIFTTKSSDYPKAFRVSSCKVVDTNKTNVEILIFWKTDTRSEQKSIFAETVKENGKWLINKIIN